MQNAGNYGGRLDVKGAWSLPENCHEFTRDYMENQYHNDVKEVGYCRTREEQTRLD